MKNYLIISLLGLAAAWWMQRQGAAAGQSLGNGWTLKPDGTAVGPNGQTAQYTGYMTGDPYPAAGNQAIF